MLLRMLLWTFPLSRKLIVDPLLVYAVRRDLQIQVFNAGKTV